MKLWNWLIGKNSNEGQSAKTETTTNIKLSASSSLVCPQCGERYLLGEDAIIVTTSSVDADLQSRGAVIIRTPVPAGGPAPSTDPALVGHFGSEDWEKERQALARTVQEIRTALDSGHRQFWVCRECANENNPHEFV